MVGKAERSKLMFTKSHECSPCVEMSYPMSFLVRWRGWSVYRLWYHEEGVAWTTSHRAREGGVAWVWQVSMYLHGSHFYGDTKFHIFSRLFPGKSNEIPGQFGFESVFSVDNIDMTKM